MPEALAPEDDLAIRALYARYNYGISNGEAEAWADCFTLDGQFSNRSTAVSGRAELIAYAEGWIASGRSRYWIDNLVLTATTAGASGTCYLAILQVGSDGRPPEVNLTGLYMDTLVPTDGGWRFASRHVVRDV